MGVLSGGIAGVKRPVRAQVRGSFVTPPRTTSELIAQHPALAAFRDYIQQRTHHEPRLEEIVVSNERPGDGKLEMSYLDSRSGNVYVAQLDASQTLEALTMRSGHMQGRDVVWNDTQRQNVAHACETLHALGG